MTTKKKPAPLRDQIVAFIATMDEASEALTHANELAKRLIEVKAPSPTLLPPAPANGTRQIEDADHERRVTKTGLIERNGAFTRHTMR